MKNHTLTLIHSKSRVVCDVQSDLALGEDGSSTYDIFAS